MLLWAVRQVQKKKEGEVLLASRGGELPFADVAVLAVKMTVVAAKRGRALDNGQCG
jgi:hypothetical protein